VDIKAIHRSLKPLGITRVENGGAADRMFRCLLNAHHYLGLHNTVGENMKYLVHNRDGRHGGMEMRRTRCLGRLAGGSA
jgi:hypothetical protein